jgi:hypothetical protein
MPMLNNVDLFYSNTLKPNEGQISKQEPSKREKILKESNIPQISFYKNGDIWIMGKQEENTCLNHIDGFEFIRLLIENEGHDVNVNTVYNTGKIDSDILQNDESNFNFVKQNLELGDDEMPTFGDRFSDQDISDPQAIQQYESALMLLEEKYETEIDLDQKLIIKEKISQLEKFISDSNGCIKNRAKFKQKDKEKCRINVQKIIKRALEKIWGELPYLKEYLNHTTIKTGNTCSYNSDPAKPIYWLTDSPHSKN